MNFRQPFFQALLVLAALSACASDVTPEADAVNPEAVGLSSGKADDATGEHAIRGRSVLVYDDAANDLYAVLSDAGLSTFSRRGLDYVYGRSVACVTNGVASACEIASRIIDDGGESFAFTVHGPRFASAASELFGAMAVAAGVDPSSTSTVESRRFVCGKDSREVWCGLRNVQGPRLKLSFDGLEPLGDDFVYEGWLITENGPVTSGRFEAPEVGEALTFGVDATLAAASTVFVLTIEPRVGDDPGPADTHVLAGSFSDGAAALTVDHPAALGTDFASASGGFLLETPTTSSIADDYDQGVWFIDPSGPGAGLDLPALPEGWVYEGWVVTESGPLSTGRFLATDTADDDGAGPTAGPDSSPPFPGQDFISPAVVVTGRPVVISVEPSPDNSAGPFTLKPLVGEAAALGAGVFQTLGNDGGSSQPTGSALLLN